MMKTLLFASAAVMALGGAASAQAGGNAYINVGYTYVDVEDVDLEFDTLTFRGGFDFHRNLGVEAEALFGLGEETITTFLGPVDIQYDYSLGIFAKAQYPVAEHFSVFARAGYSYVEIDTDFGGDDSDGPAFGAGAEFSFGEGNRNAIRAEYTRYDFEDDFDTNTFGAAYVRRFGM